SDYSNADVQAFTPTGGFLFQWGSAGSGNGQFSFINGLYVDSGGKVYVTEQGNNRVQVFDAIGNFLFTFGTVGTGNGQFNNPGGIWADLNGNIYVADENNRRIEKFDSNGNFILAWGSQGSGNGQFTWPVAPALDPTGQFVYVVDADANARVQKFDANGNYLSQWGGFGTGNGQFSSPRGIATDCAGNVYVTDFTNPRVQVFDGNGTYLTQFGSSAQFINPEAISVDQNGNVYVGDWNGNKIVKYSLCTGTLNCGGPFMVAKVKSLTVLKQTSPTPSPTTTPSPTPSFFTVAAPNISRGGTPIQFLLNLEKPARVTLVLFNLSGEKVFEESSQGAGGANTLTWNLQNRMGGEVSSGLYVYVLTADDGTSARTQRGKVVVIR
ncbi:MAG TPA: 6-bladed beta-propeller, partial [bacterium]|nr:6-bladed beta-propeller [bacterium]